MNQLANKRISRFVASVAVAFFAFQSPTRAESYSVENWPAGTTQPTSGTMTPPDFDTDDFGLANILKLQGLDELPPAVAVIVFLAAARLAEKAGGIDSPFRVLLDATFSSGNTEGLSEALGNSDPFIAFETTLTNTSDVPLAVSFSFTQGTIPIPIETPLMFETFLTAEVTDTGGDGAAAADSVFASYGRSLSDVTRPTEFNTVGGEVALDGVFSLVDGVLATDNTPPSNLFVSNLDVDFFDGLGVPVEDRGTIAMSASLFIDGLSPGDTITVRYGYSIGTDDGTIPFFPAEALVAALEQDTFSATPGDFDNDGDIDGNDFLIWQAGFGVDDGGDADGDGDTDGNDFLIWQSGFGTGEGSATPSSVPEPTAIALLAAMAAACAFASCRKRDR